LGTAFQSPYIYIYDLNSLQISLARLPARPAAAARTTMTRRKKKLTTSKMRKVETAETKKKKR